MRENNPEGIRFSQLLSSIFYVFFLNYLILHIVLYIVLVVMDYKIETRFIYIHKHMQSMDREK